MNRILKNVIAATLLCGPLSICGCGAEAPAETEPVLTGEEAAALEEEYTIEAIETIDETNAEAELQKLTREIEADK